MLLITRRMGEAIVINGSIEVKVLEIKGGRVKLGFEYPPGSSVFRQELFSRIQTENQAAALTHEAPTSLPDKLSTMVRNLRSSSPSPEIPSAGDGQEGSKNDDRTLNPDRHTPGSPSHE